MDVDVNISRWVLELLLTDRRMDSITKQVLAVAPLPVLHDWRLKKSLLLRTIESSIDDDVSVTEPILQALEDIEALDRRQGIPTTAAMRAAYCAVATECTVKFLICFGQKYLEALDRIWRGRVRVLESERSELVTAELKERWDEVEAAIWDRNVSKWLARMNTRNDALRLVVAYVKEAWDSMGPPFLACAAKLDMFKGNVGNGCGNEVRIASGNEKSKVQTENGADLGDGSKPDGNGGNVGDGGEAEVEMERITEVVQGSDLVISTGVPSKAGSAVVVASTNGDGVGGGKELKGQRENGWKAEVQMVRDTMVVQGSELEISAKARSAVEVALTKGDDGGVGKELKGRREIGVNVSDGSGVKAGREAWGVGKSYVGEVTVAVPRFGGLLGFHKANGILQAVGPVRSAPNVNRGVLSFKPATKEREIPTAVPLRHKYEPVNIRDAEYVGRDASDGIHNDVSAEVRVVQQELKSSVMALHNTVEKNTEPDHSNCDTHGNLTSGDQKDVPPATGKEYDAPSLSANKGKATEYVQSGDPYCGDLCCSNQKSGPRPGLMERNSTAHTYKWDDSLGISPEGTVEGRLHVPIPKQNANSSLKNCEAKRRKVKRWSVHEEDTLRTGVKEYGQGNWMVILRAYQDVFEERTQVDLKDKWRNMSK